MRNVKWGIAGIAVMLMVGLNTGQARATEEIEKPILGLDPSSTVETSNAVGDNLKQKEDSRSKNIVQIGNSKKGLQGTEWTSAVNSGELGIKHILLNIELTPFLIDGDTDYNYNGKTYKFNSDHVKRFEETVQPMNTAGITVTAVLLVQDDPNLKDWDKLVYAPERGHNFYALGTKTQEARDTWSALFGFLVERFGQPGNYIENWVLGNEVNMPSAYNWTGTISAAINAQVYADSFILLYNVLEKQNQVNPDRAPAKAYVSLDRSWRDTGGYTGIGAKDFLDRFARAIDAKQAGVNWCLAFHPYAVVMDPTSNKFSQSDKLLWGDNKYTPNNIDAQFVTAANLNVLTDYVKKTYGPEHRIILSEQGFDAKGGEDYQAASLAYTFYAGQFNDMVDAIIFRSWEDHPEEMGLQLGIKGRKSEKVFKLMDTNFYAGATSSSLRTIGIKNWKELVPTFDMPGMGYQDVAYDDWYMDYVKEVSQSGVMTGMNPDYFGAAENLKRGQFATVLYRVEGSPAQNYINRFGDVADGQFYSLPISWAAQQNVVTGYNDNQNFGTDDDMTREQLVTMMYRYANHQGKDTSQRVNLNTYADVAKISGFATEAMQWGVAVGIIKGEGGTGHINPQGHVNRAVCAAVIQRYTKL